VALPGSHTLEGFGAVAGPAARSSSPPPSRCWRRRLLMRPWPLPATRSREANDDLLPQRARWACHLGEKLRRLVLKPEGLDDKGAVCPTVNLTLNTPMEKGMVGRPHPTLWIGDEVDGPTDI